MEWERVGVDAGDEGAAADFLAEGVVVVDALGDHAAGGVKGEALDGSDVAHGVHDGGLHAAGGGAGEGFSVEQATHPACRLPVTPGERLAAQVRSPDVADGRAPAAAEGTALGGSDGSVEFDAQDHIPAIIHVGIPDGNGGGAAGRGFGDFFPDAPGEAVIVVFDEAGGHGDGDERRSGGLGEGGAFGFDETVGGVPSVGGPAG